MSAGKREARKDDSGTKADSTTTSTTRRHPARKIIEEVIVKYHHQNESTSRILIIKDEGGGRFVDAIVFENGIPAQGDKRLIDHLGLKQDDGSYAPVTPVKGGDAHHRKWQVQSFVEQGDRENHCVWIHDESCYWSENCD